MITETCFGNDVGSMFNFVICLGVSFFVTTLKRYLSGNNLVYETAVSTHMYPPFQREVDICCGYGFSQRDWANDVRYYHGKGQARVGRSSSFFGMCVISLAVLTRLHLLLNS